MLLYCRNMSRNMSRNVFACLCLIFPQGVLPSSAGGKDGNTK